MSNERNVTITAILCAATAAVAPCQSSVDLQVVLDPNTTTIGSSSSPSTGDESGTEQVAVLANGYAYFNATTALGRELWRCQTGTGSAQMVADLRPGIVGSEPRNLTAVGNLLFFTADDGTLGRELWRTDGTASGTTLVADLTAGATGTEFGAFAAGGNRLFFSCDLGLGYELYMHDVAAGTTSLVLDIRPGADSANVFSLQTAPNGNSVVFVADDGVHGPEVWASSGGATDTYMLADLNVGAGSSSANLYSALELGGYLYFGASSATNEPLVCRTDGGSVEVVRTFPSMPFLRTPVPLFTFGNEAFYQIDTPGFGYEIFRTDGTAAGTTMFDDLNPGAGSTTIWGTAVAGDDATFFVDLGNDLLISDGSVSGTTIYPDVDVSGMRGLGAGVICNLFADLAVGQELYSIQPNGSVQLVSDIAPGAASSAPYALTPFGGAVLFSGEADATGRELYVTDSTAAGTTMIGDIDPRTTTGEFRTSGKISAGDRAFLGGNAPGYGRELWITDGTTAGTQLVLDIHPGEGDSRPTAFATLGLNVVFRANDGVHGDELWFSDGTANGTHLVKDIQPGSQSSAPDYSVSLDGVAYFTADDGVHGAELWRTDGTENGTYLLADIAAGSVSSYPRDLTVGGRYVFFRADDAVHGSELWRTDGTAQGTILVSDIQPGSGGSFPDEISPLRDGVAFLANFPGQTRVWTSDGNSVTQVADNNDLNNNRVDELETTQSGRIYVVTQGVPVFNQIGDLYMIENGTVTQLSFTAVADFPQGLRTIGERAVFRNAADGTLWGSDGTVAGTGPIATINASIFESHVIGDILYFEGRSEAEGSALWRTDGTVAGSFQIASFIPGEVGADVEDFVQVKGDLVFFADGLNQQNVMRVLRRPGASVLPFGRTCGASDRALQATPAQLGATLTVDAMGPASATGCVVGVDFTPGFAFQLDGCEFYFGPGAAAAFNAVSPNLTATIQVPNDPMLIDSEFTLQAFWLDSALTFSTSKGLWITIDDK